VHNKLSVTEKGRLFVRALREDTTCPSRTTSELYGRSAVLKMPRELPGFYFDVEKNRYFPSSSKHAGKSHPPLSQPPADRPHTSEAASPSSSTPPPPNARRPSPDAWHALQLSRLATCPRQRIATLQLRCVATRAADCPNSYLLACVSLIMTAQLEASAAYQAIPIPVFTGRTLTAFAVRL
jgi:hypothetical protein